MDALLIWKLEVDPVNTIRCLQQLSRHRLHPHGVFFSYDLPLVFVAAVILGRPYVFVRRFWLGTFSIEDWQHIQLSMLLLIIQNWPSADCWQQGRFQALAICRLQMRSRAT